MKIKEIQSKIMLLLPHDKCLHFLVGFIIFSITNLFLGNLFSLGIVAVIALLKECYDEYDYGGFDIVDFIFTILPGLILLIKQMIK